MHIHGLRKFQEWSNFWLAKPNWARPNLNQSEGRDDCNCHVKVRHLVTISNWKHDSLNWNFASYRKWLWVIDKNPKLPRTAWPVAWPFVHIQPYFGCRRCRLRPELGHGYLVHSLSLEYPVKLKNLNVRGSARQKTPSHFDISNHYWNFHQKKKIENIKATKILKKWTRANWNLITSDRFGPSGPRTQQGWTRIPNSFSLYLRSWIHLRYFFLCRTHFQFIIFSSICFFIDLRIMGII